MGFDMRQFDHEANMSLLAGNRVSDMRPISTGIASWPKADRPWERLLEGEKLSEAELLANHSAGGNKGQRKACGCIVSKDIGIYDT